MAEDSPAAKELIVMAASLHDRALKLERAPGGPAETAQAVSDSQVAAPSGARTPGAEE